jgi:outer membrane protein OmpA-like peptidoglycan-associated protein
VVRKALLDRGLGKDGDARLTSSGKGAAEPIADNATDEGRAKNRRVELIRG